VSGRIVECKDTDTDETAAKQSQGAAAGLAIKSWFSRHAVAWRPTPTEINPAEIHPAATQTAWSDDTAAAAESAANDSGVLSRFPWLFGKTRQAAPADDEAGPTQPVAQNTSAAMLFQE
jgi:hypothetical protein